MGLWDLTNRELWSGEAVGIHRIFFSPTGDAYGEVQVQSGALAGWERLRNDSTKNPATNPLVTGTSVDSLVFTPDGNGYYTGFTGHEIDTGGATLPLFRLHGNAVPLVKNATGARFPTVGPDGELYYVARFGYNESAVVRLSDQTIMYRTRPSESIGRIEIAGNGVILLRDPVQRSEGRHNLGDYGPRPTVIRSILMSTPVFISIRNKPVPLWRGLTKEKGYGSWVPMIKIIRFKRKP